MAPWVLSARTDVALAQGAARLAQRVRGDGSLDVADVASTLATGRARFDRRAVVVGRAIVRGCWTGWTRSLSGELGAGVSRGVARAGKTVMVFPGQGSQWAGMAVALARSSRVFAERLAACGEALSAFVTWSLEDVLRGAPGAPGFDRIDVVQPALFAVTVSLAELWRSCGVVPDVVVGHSQGETAAAHVAGALSLEDAARVVALRSRALVHLVGEGAMVSLALGSERARALIERWGPRLSLAAFNGPNATVVCGDDRGLARAARRCARRRGCVRGRSLRPSRRIHREPSASVRRSLRCSRRSVRRTAAVAMVSTVTGERVDGGELDAQYWYRGLREPVRFEQATRRLIEDGAGVFVEVSAHPVLTIAVQDTIDAVPGERDRVAVLGSLRRDDGGLDRFVASLGDAFVAGVDVDWGAVLGGAGRTVELPGYAFERSRHWLSPSAGTGDVRGVGLESAEHPLLGAAVALAEGGLGVHRSRVARDASVAGRSCGVGRGAAARYGVCGARARGGCAGGLRGA